MTMLERVNEWAMVLVSAIFGWVWIIEKRVSSLETHHQYTKEKLVAIESKLDVLIKRT